MFKLNAKFDADSLFYLLSHFECNGHTVHMLTQCIYCPHWLVQWSHQCSHMCVPVHSPWLPGYTDVVQTILIILTAAGLFPDRPCHIYNICTVSGIVSCAWFLPFPFSLPLVTTIELLLPVWWLHRLHRLSLEASESTGARHTFKKKHLFLFQY